jgi:hypothetical protein
VRYLLVIAALLLVFEVGTPIVLCAHTGPSASPEEYKVYEAVFGLMDQIPRQDLHVSLWNMTLNSKCGEDDSGVPLANGCSFLWVKPDDANSVKRLLRTEWQRLDNATWSDFEAKSAASVHLQDPIVTPWKHELVGPEDNSREDSQSPDLAIFVSRVGFNQKKTEAIVYVLIFSYMDQVSTAGDYFLFRLNKAGRWEPNGRVTYFTVGADQ